MFRVSRKSKVQPIQMSVYEIPTYCFNVEKEVDGKPWYHDIFHYVKNQPYLKGISKNDKRTLKSLSMSFFSNGEVLYKKRKDQMVLRCVEVNEEMKILEEIHEGACGSHASGTYDGKTNFEGRVLLDNHGE